jgi:hypothetical protein
VLKVTHILSQLGDFHGCIKYYSRGEISGSYATIILNNSNFKLLFSWNAALNLKETALQNN